MTELEPVATPTKRKAAWDFLVRWQEYAGWAPLCIALAIIAWVVLGSLDRNAATGALPVLGMLPIKLAYAVLACGVMFLVRRRWRRKLTKGEQDALWDELTNASLTLHRSLDGRYTLNLPFGPIAIFLADLVFSLCALYWLLQYFSLPA